VSLPREVLEIGLAAPLDGFNLHGLFLTGSFARGEAAPNSDIDLLALASDGTTWRKFYRVGARDVDLFILPTERAIAAIEKREQPFLRILATAEILDDRTGQMRRILGRALKAYREGPAPPDPTDLRNLRHRVITVIDDAYAAKDVNPGAAVIALCSELQNLSDLYLTTIGEWNVAPRFIERTIAKTNPELARRFAIVSGEQTTIAERIDAFECLIEIILAPYGGPLRYFETKRSRGASRPLESLAEI